MTSVQAENEESPILPNQKIVLTEKPDQSPSASGALEAIKLGRKPGNLQDSKDCKPGSKRKAKVDSLFRRKDTVVALMKKTAKINSASYPSTYLIFMTEQRLIMKSQNRNMNGKFGIKLTGEMWRNLSGKQKLVYDMVSDKCRSAPIQGIDFDTFEGIQQYKKMLGYPYYPPLE